MKQFLFSIAVLLGFPYAAQAGAIACPDSIKVEEQEAAATPQGWHSFSDSDSHYLLDAIAVYGGKKKPARLDATKNTEEYSEWNLLNNGKDKYYVLCSYTHTSVLLRRELEETLKHCRVAFEPDPRNPKGPQVMHKFTCE